MFATLKEIEALLVSERIAPAAAANDESSCSGPQRPRNSTNPGFAADTAFFRLLGLTDIKALDYSPYEDAEIVHDLNLPIPAELRNKFSLIIDGGTLEHVFDTRQAFANAAGMLKSGGRIIHLSPVNNQANHGFYQFSPTFFFDYYRANAFTNLRGFLTSQTKNPLLPRSWEVWELPASGHTIITSKQDQPLGMIFIAEKTEASTTDKIPIQSLWLQEYGQEGGAGVGNLAAARGLKRTLGRMLPERAKILLKRLFPRLDVSNRPWGLKSLGRLR